MERLSLLATLSITAHQLQQVTVRILILEPTQTVVIIIRGIYKILYFNRKLKDAEIDFIETELKEVRAH